MGPTPSLLVVDLQVSNTDTLSKDGPVRSLSGIIAGYVGG